MHTDLLSLSGLAPMFILGLRHGLDPDHIACIDGITWRTVDHNHELAPWVGTLFAVGHGLLVTGIAVVFSMFARDVPLPEAVMQVLSWIPTGLLLFVGLLNLRQLVQAGVHYKPAGWKLRLIPNKLRNHTSPMAIVLTGVLFAMVFDTATQASAWGSVAASDGGVIAALCAGLVFTLGMIITDTVDARLMCRVIRRTDDQEASRRYRQTLGWLIVALSFGVAGYNILTALIPSAELGELGYSLVGGAMLAMILLIWVWNLRSKDYREA